MQQNNIDRIISIVTLVLSFLMPVFFLPVTTEFYEFNKLALLYLATAIMVGVWIVKVIKRREIQLVKSGFDLPFALLLMVVVLSSIFAINKNTSIYGSQGRWFPSMYATAVLFFFYYAVSSSTNSYKTIKNAISAMTFSLAVNSVISILSYYSIYIGSQTFFRMSNFNLTGSVTTAATLAAVGVISSFLLLCFDNSMAKKPLYLISGLVNFFFVILAGFNPAWVILFVGLAAMLMFVPKSRFSENRIFLSMGIGTIIALSLITRLPATKELVLNNNGIAKEIVLPANDSWVISSSTIQNFPLLGTGPSSFYLNFPRYRSLALNNTSYWNIRFDKPSNEVFNSLANFGLVGISLVALCVLKYLKISLASAKAQNSDEGTGIIVGVLALALLPIYLFTYATVLTAFVSTLLVAFMTSNLARNGKNRVAETVSISLSGISPVTTTLSDASVIKKEYLSYILMTPVVAVLIYSGYITFRFYSAEYYSRASINAALANDAAKIFDYQTKAINANPTRHNYHNNHAQTSLALANSIASKQNLTDTDKQNVQQLIAESIRNIRLSTEMVNPTNVSSWELRAEIYKAITPVAENANDFAIKAYNNAIQLDQTNPTLRLNLGSIYYTMNDYLTAASLFRQAASLKQDYANAHFNFAVALAKLQDYENARREFEITKQLVDSGSQDLAVIDAEIAKLPLPSNTGNKPSVEQIEGSANNKSTNGQDPLTTPDQQKSSIPESTSSKQ